MVTATILQGVTSYTLTQLLSKAGQRLIAELRAQVQEHIGRLPVAFYDENRTGTLVARIMNDVEGVRNIIGTGVVDFFGGLLTALFAFMYLVKLSVQMTIAAFNGTSRFRGGGSARTTTGGRRFGTARVRLTAGPLRGCTVISITSPAPAATGTGSNPPSETMTVTVDVLFVLRTTAI